ncbi:MAG TPA: hypothetical protein VJ964_08110 [Balneolaceae bacterium]|nr:hypothetical protein [Balneolaceae bacterium]
MKTRKQESNMSGSFLKGVLGIMCFLCLGVLTSRMAHAQNNVVIKYGANRHTAELLKSKTQVLLAAVAEWQHTGKDHFPDDPGVPALKKLVKNKGLTPGLDTLITGMVRYKNTYEVPRIFMRSRHDGAYDFREVILSFSPDGELLNARLANRQQNFDRILSRHEYVSVEDEQSTIKSFLDSYTQAFNQKDSKTLGQLFDKRALIITGMRNRSTGTFDYTRYRLGSYLNKLDTEIFMKHNHISVRFTNPVVYRHPDFSGIYGVLTKQYWETTDYRDVGFLFFIVDTRGDQPVILARKWQKKPFKTDHFSLALPVAMKQEKVEWSDSVADSRGVVRLKLQGKDKHLLNPEIVKQWMKEGTLHFEGIVVDSEDIEIRNQSTLTFPFSLPLTAFTHKVMSSVHLKETASFQANTMKMPLYLSRINELSLNVLNKGEQPQQPEFLDLTSALRIRSKADSVNIAITTPENHKVKALFQRDTTSVVHLLEGPYRINFSKPGYLPLMKNVRIHRLSNSTVFATLDKFRSPVPLAETQRKRFISKKGWWFIGGAAVLIAGSSAILMINHGSGPGIPVPPGRPLGK